MGILEQNEANLIDAEEVNWRIVVYPLIVVLALVVAGFGYYYYQQNQREEMEVAARAALVEAKTPDAMIKVADQFPKADGATLALLSAADASFTKRDFASAIADYQRIIASINTDPELRDAAQIGLGSAFEAAGKPDDAVRAYSAVGDRGPKSSFAPFAYYAAASIYEQRGDKDNQRKMLTQAASLDPDSAFVTQAKQKLQAMQSITLPTAQTPAK